MNMLGVVSVYFLEEGGLKESVTASGGLSSGSGCAMGR